MSRGSRAPPRGAPSRPVRGEPLVSFETYLLGVGTLFAIVVAVGLTARRLRTHFFSDWSVAPALLAQSVIGIALLVTLAQIVGTFGQFRRAPLVLAALIACLAAWFLTSAPRGGEHARTSLRTSAAVILALLVALTPWLARTFGALRTGVLGYDSLNYHLPFAARDVQSGHVASLVFTFPGIETAFHPANSELIHGVGILALGRDTLSPLLNLGWLSLALLAAWCVGRSRNLGPLTLAAVVALLSSPQFVAFLAGRATNDIAAIALFLAAVALLLNGEDSRPATALAAVACGLALGTKLTMVIPVVALTVGAIAIARRGARVATAGVWLGGLVAAGGYWYVRNLVAVGSPIPALHLGIGPISFPVTRFSRAYPTFTVAHYLGDVGVWRSWFLPGLRESFGWGWPVIVGLGAAGWLLALMRGDRVLRMLGAVGIVSFLGYLVTPQSAGGPPGRPVLFANDLRFAFPALVLGLVLLPLVVSRTSQFARVWLPSLLAIALLNDALYLTDIRGSLVAVALAAELAVLGVVVVLMRGPPLRPNRALVALGCAFVLAIGAGAGWLVQRSYLSSRYADVAHDVPYASAPRPELVALYGWVRHVSDARIALVGLAISYPLFGADLSNHVQYIGHKGPHGAFDRVGSCREWRQLLNAGNYDFVVVSGNARGARVPVEARWTRSDPAAEVVLEVGTASVFRVSGTFDSGGCG
jgi:hypothetical protein